MIAPGRRARPGAPRPGTEGTAASSCPFCEHREQETPPEAFAVAPPGRIPNTPGWTVRVVPNKYPALAEPDGRSEVVVHSPRHVLSLADLSEDELAGRRSNSLALKSSHLSRCHRAG